MDDANVSIEVLEAMSAHLRRFSSEMRKINASMSVGLSNYFREFEILRQKLMNKMVKAGKEYDEAQKRLSRLHHSSRSVFFSACDDNQQKRDAAMHALRHAEATVKLLRITFEKCQADYYAAERLIGSCNKEQSYLNTWFSYLDGGSQFAQKQLVDIMDMVRQYDWISYHNQAINAPYADASGLRQKSDSESEATGIRSIAIVGRDGAPATNSITLIDQTPLNGFGTIRLMANEEGVFSIPDNLESNDCAIYIRERCIYRGVLTDKIRIVI